MRILPFGAAVILGVGVACSGLAATAAPPLVPRLDSPKIEPMPVDGSRLSASPILASRLCCALCVLPSRVWLFSAPSSCIRRDHPPAPPPENGGDADYLPPSGDYGEYPPENGGYRDYPPENGY